MFNASLCIKDLSSFQIVSIDWFRISGSKGAPLSFTQNIPLRVCDLSAENGTWKGLTP